jgi:hypothetical protein
MAPVLKNADRPGVNGNPAGKKPGTRHRVSSRASPRKLKAGNAKDVAVAALAKAESTESKLKEARSQAKLVIHPAANAALVIAEFGDHFGDFNVGELAARLKDGMDDVSNNDLRSCEAMLYCQAHALQAIFVDSLLQVKKHEWFSTSEAFMRMALKAQASAVRHLRP